MSILHISIIITLLLFFLLGSGLWVSFALLLLGMLAMLMNGNDWGYIAAGSIWNSLSIWSLTALPMFLWMGEILFRTKLSENLFDGLSVWLKPIPGKLFHANIASCGIFAAVSGSSAATVATIGKITLGHLQQLGYKKSLLLGTLGGSATLGLLIPPSIVLIVFGVAADVSIARLFIAGVLPGTLLLVLFSVYVIIYCKIFPEAVPKANSQNSLKTNKIKALLKLLPVLSLIVLVIGSIYTGIATPNEAAAIGVVASLILAKLEGSLNKKVLIEGLFSAVKVNSMLLFIIASASVLSIAMAYIGIPRELVNLIAEMQLSSGMLLILLGVIFLLLGCFLDGISIILLTISVILPVIQQANIDLIWFGIFLVLLVEMAQITPPVGFNLFILQSMTGENIFKIAYYNLPFFMMILVALFVIWFFPEIVTYLPQAMHARH